MPKGVTATPAQPASPAPPALEFRGIHKSYGRVRAVDDLALVVERAEVLTLLGPSGSGKTTILMMLAGFIQPDQGLILLDGRDITRVPPQKRNLGVVFQNYALFPHRTVEENIAFPLRMRGVSRDEQRDRTGGALELVRLAGLEHRYPRELSGGQQQRVALARALVFQPPILLMDEPLGALDRALRKEMQFELKQLHEQLDLTIIYVTHDQEEALTLSTRIAILRDGRIEQLADPESLYRRPANAFVARFIGDTNLISGRLVRMGSGVALETNAGLRLPVAGAGSDKSQTLAIRPEHIRIRPWNGGVDLDVAEDGPDVLVRGRVAEALYLGEAWAYQLKWAGGLDLRAKCSADGAALQRGADVEVRWAKADALLLDGDKP